jgi:geranylgeranylglycerol-phosphate geranylgeranyltransferase
MVGLAVLVGIAVVQPASVTSSVAVLGFFTGFLLTGYSMVVNDLYDLAVDRVNAPSRPLPSGRLGIRGAVWLAMILLLTGLLTASYTGWSNLLVAGGFAALAWLYNSWGKERGLVGNAIVAASIAVPYVYGGLAVGAADRPLLWLLASTSFVAGVGREVVKTIADVAGDELREVRSVARMQGPRRASQVAATFFVLAVLFAILPVGLRLVAWVYAAAVAVPAALFVYLASAIVRDPSAGSARRVKRYALLGMLLGLVAFVVGGSVAL